MSVLPPSLAVFDPPRLPEPKVDRLDITREAIKPVTCNPAAFITLRAEDLRRRVES